MDELDQKIISVLQEDLPLVSHPFKYLANDLGISEAELIIKIQKYQAEGKIRKIGAVLRHQKVGFTANALCVFVVSQDKLSSAGNLMANHPKVSHCYTRITYKNWPYNLYAMIHGYSREECQAVADNFANQLGISDYQLLFSTHEWKKTNMKYFGT